MKHHRTLGRYSLITLIGALSIAAGYWLGHTPQPVVVASLYSADAELAVEPGHRVAAVAAATPTSDPRPVAANPAPQPSTPHTNARNARNTMDAETLGLSRLAIGRELLDSGDLEGSYDAYRDAVAVYPSAETHSALGGLYFRIAARDKAYVQFRRAVELDPYNADLWLDLANAEHMRVAVGQEWKAVRRAKEIDPEIQIARDESGYYYRDADDPKAFTSSRSHTLRRIP